MISNKITKLFFDLDGTITDSSQGIVNCAIYALEYLCLPIPNRNELLRFIGPPLRDTFPKFGVKNEDVELAVSKYRERYVTVGKFENTPYNGIYNLLEGLIDSGYELYLATSKPEQQTYDILEKFNLTKYFKFLACATNDGTRDSKTSVIKYLISNIDNFTSAYMIGDTIYDIEGAKNCNINSIAVGWGFGNKQEMINAGADFFANDINDLFNYLIKK